MQLATAYSAMVNGGTQVTPHVVAAIGNQPVPATPGAQVISPTISATLTNLMSYVVHTVPWYAAGTLVKGYTIGGKTGTAQIWDPKANHGHGGWMANRYNNSFVGYIGKNTPRAGHRGRDPRGQAARRPAGRPAPGGGVV